jgi:hypothetical protein
MTINSVAPLRELSQREASVAGVDFCSSCGVRLGVNDHFCRACRTGVGDVEGPVAHATPTQVNRNAVPPAWAAPQPPEGHRRRSRAFVTAGILIVLIAVAAALVLTLGNSGPTFSRWPAPALIALLGIVTMWAAAMVLALALCRTAAAGDRAMLDCARTTAPRAELAPHENPTIPTAVYRPHRRGAAALAVRPDR